MVEEYKTRSCDMIGSDGGHVTISWLVIYSGLHSNGDKRLLVLHRTRVADSIVYTTEGEEDAVMEAVNLIALESSDRDFRKAAKLLSSMLEPASGKVDKLNYTDTLTSKAPCGSCMAVFHCSHRRQVSMLCVSVRFVAQVKFRVFGYVRFGFKACQQHHQMQVTGRGGAGPGTVRLGECVLGWTNLIKEKDDLHLTFIDLKVTLGLNCPSKL